MSNSPKSNTFIPNVQQPSHIKNPSDFDINGRFPSFIASNRDSTNKDLNSTERSAKTIQLDVKNHAIKPTHLPPVLFISNSREFADLEKYARYLDSWMLRVCKLFQNKNNVYVKCLLSC